MRRAGYPLWNGCWRSPARPTKGQVDKAGELCILHVLRVGLAVKGLAVKGLAVKGLAVKGLAVKGLAVDDIVERTITTLHDAGETSVNRNVRLPGRGVTT